jgi:hypothetical protein
MQRLAGRFVKFDRSEAAAFEHLTDIVERRDEIAHRSADVRLEIAVSDYALFRIEIDQDQGPIGACRNARYNRPVELQHDRARPNALQRQTLEAHSTPFPRSGTSIGCINARLLMTSNAALTHFSMVDTSLELPSRVVRREMHLPLGGTPWMLSSGFGPVQALLADPVWPDALTRFRSPFVQ